MKIGYYCESPADRAALEVFTGAILGEPLEPSNIDLEAHRVPGFFSAPDGVFRGVHYLSDAEGLIIVVDGDESELHDPGHDTPGAAGEGCRLCQIRAIIARVRKQLKARKDRPALRMAVGPAVPAIEAWYLVGKEHQVGESAWRVGLASGQLPFTRPQLKKLVYGTDRPSLELETERAVAEARRLRQDIEAIESAFPDGFRPVAQEIRSWRTQ